MSDTTRIAQDKPAGEPRKFRVHLTQVVSVTVDVEAADENEAIDTAYEEAPAGVCAQCSGWGREWSRDDDGELCAEAVEDESGNEVWADSWTWQRVLKNAGAER